MNLMKTAFVAGAASVFVTTAAQSADLPVKAKAIEYVRICSAYGAGFYYIPGTDTCIKVGGYVRFEAYHNAPQGAYPVNNATGAFTRHATTFASNTGFENCHNSSRVIAHRPPPIALRIPISFVRDAAA